MDPRSRLWGELIFPRCDTAGLLALRAVCHAFLAQLSAAPARLWQPLTMDISRMSYRERVEGWRGVERAMARERKTRSNCDAKRFVRGPALDAPNARHVQFVGGRAVAVSDDEVRLLDIVTGALVASFNEAVDDTICTVSDRWMAFVVESGIGLLDCVTGRLGALAPVDESLEGACITFSTAGPCISFSVYASMEVMVMHLSVLPDGTTAVRNEARVALHHWDDRFALCEKGRSFILYESSNAVLKLADLTTHQAKRVFTPPAGAKITGCQFYANCAFVAAAVDKIAAQWEQSHCAFRISDGHASAVYGCSYSLLCHADRVYSIATFKEGPSFVDAMTGAILSRSGVGRVVVDSSGALLARSNEGMLSSRSGAAGKWRALVKGPSPEEPVDFRYGMCVIRSGGEYFVIRFDG